MADWLRSRHDGGLLSDAEHVSWATPDELAPPINGTHYRGRML